MRLLLFMEMEDKIQPFLLQKNVQLKLTFQIAKINRWKDNTTFVIQNRLTEKNQNWKKYKFHWKM